MSSPYGSPPPSNPVLTAYESFVRETPLVTRYTMTGMFCSYIASWFVNPGSAFDNTALHSLLHFELYRIILAPLVCNEIVSFLFGSFSLFSSGIRLENSIGSTAFLTVLLAIGGLTNIIFLVTCLLLCLITGSNLWLLARSSGIWTIVLGLVAMECSKAPSGSTRRFIFASVPTLYYPLAILAFFSLMSKQIRLSYVISVLVGYAFGFNKLTFLQPSTNRCSSWENGILSNFTQRPGWITGHSASGLSAWETLPTFQGGGEWTPTVISQRDQQSSSSQQPTQQTPIPTFESNAGRLLGGDNNNRLSQRSNARDAMLEAAERRAQQQQQQSSK